VSDDAPDWQETNPFGFSFSAIEAFFKKHLSDYWGIKVEEIEPDITRLTSDAYLPFSRTWFEVKILNEISFFDYCFQDSKEREDVKVLSPGYRWGHAFSLGLAFKSAGKIGRMVEHYRWRFSYGQDALRGRASVMAAKAGGLARAKLSKSASAARIDKMRQLIEAGHSRARAAELAHKAGFGPSKEANRKLWTRFAQAKPER
ncbi:MAG: hypothetical protein K5905_22165, partial [Roseibium sp.]|uniref:hypothetical protein n=1 Tax=Roseibium sp. TaxID=1936156 RepID=UPI00261C2E54